MKHQPDSLKNFTEFDFNQPEPNLKLVLNFNSAKCRKLIFGFGFGQTKKAQNFNQNCSTLETQYSTSLRWGKYKLAGAEVWR